MDLMKAAAEAAELLSGISPIIALTGAGISVESGIPPFRGPGGLWERYDPDEYGHIDTFRKDPGRSWEMLMEIIEGSLSAKPNEAHLSLSRLEGRGIIGPVITQNIDGLHQAGGSRDVLELHGNARAVTCAGCGRKEELRDLSSFSPRCGCGGWKRPNIVFFGEPLPERVLARALVNAEMAGAIIVVGTSGIVHPAAMIPEIVKRNGGKVVEINPFSTIYTDSITDVFLESTATEGLKLLERSLPC